jgi:hypothetical protein
VNKLLTEVSAIIETPAPRVADLLLTVQPGPVTGANAWLFAHLVGGATLHGGPERFSYTGNGYSGTIELDRAEQTIAYQGGWWYRGEYTLESHPRGTRIIHRVYNAAPWGRWGVPLANRFFIGFADRTRSAFAVTLANIGTELGCPTHLDR